MNLFTKQKQTHRHRKEKQKKKENPELHWWLNGKESPANPGDMGLIPGLGRAHMPGSN